MNISRGSMALWPMPQPYPKVDNNALKVEKGLWWVKHPHLARYIRSLNGCYCYK